jgi:hypothetical protein
MRPTLSHRLGIGVIGLALGILLDLPTAHAASTLRWKVNPGDSFAFEVKQVMRQTMNVAGQKVETNSETTTGMTWSIDKVDREGLIHVTMIHDRIRMSVTAPRQPPIVFDSAEEAAGETAKAFEKLLGPMIGAQFRLVMNDRGQVTEFNVPERALEGLESNPLIKQFFSRETIKQMATSGSPVFPEETLAVGDNWKNSFELKTPFGAMTTHSTYTYRGEESREGRPLERIDVDLEMEIGDAPGAGGAKLSLKDQSSEGASWFDARGGHFAGSELKQTLTMTVETFGQKVDTNTETTTKVTVTKLK